MTTRLPLRVDFARTARKQAILTANSQAATVHGNSISASTDVLKQELAIFINSATQHVDRLHHEIRQFETEHVESLTAQTNRVEEQLQQLVESIIVVQNQDRAESKVLQAMQSTLQDTITSLQTESVAWNEKWKETSQRQRQTIEDLSNESFSSLENALKAMTSLTEGILKEALHFIDTEQRLMHKARSLAENVNETEILRLKRQNQVLMQLLDDEKQKAQKAQHDLLQRISSMLGDYVNERDRSLRQAVGLVQNENQEALDTLSTFATNHDQIMASNQEKALEVDSTLREKGQEHKRTRDMVFKVSILTIFLMQIIYIASEVTRRNTPKRLFRVRSYAHCCHRSGKFLCKQDTAVHPGNVFVMYRLLVT